ncbi:MAG: alpha/beta fold hydrolase [Janthinobacterium lividum]
MIRLDAVLTTPPPAPRLAAALAAAFALAACSAAPRPPSPDVTAAAPDAPFALPGPAAAPAAFPAPDLVLPMPDGLALPARAWLPPPGTPVRRAILALHGFNDSRDAWAIPAPAFAAAGSAVIAPDLRGFGATPTRGRWPGADALVSDAAASVRAVRARFPGVPVVVMGESMGGAVALLLAATPGDAPDATVLLAPAVWSRAELGPVLSATLSAAAALAPAHEVTGRELPLRVVATDNRAALLALIHDPLTIHATRLDVLAGLVDLMDRAALAAPRARGPVLVLDGGHDRIVPPAATAATWAALPASARRAFYPSGYHLLLRDRDRALPTADIAAWLDTPDRWLPSGADVAAAAWTANHDWRDEPAPWLPANLDGLAGHDPLP